MFHGKHCQKRIHYPIRKRSPAGQDALDRLNAFLDAEEPRPVEWLTTLWGDQQQAITYKELRAAIENGYMDLATLQAWQKDYSNFVVERLQPMWADAMKAGAAATEARFLGFYFDTLDFGTRNWTTVHGAEWVTSVTDQQRDAIAAMIDRAYTGEWTVDELARAIRPTIGLTTQQSLANLKYYQNIKATLLENNPKMREATAEKRARDAALKYAGQQHRQRAHTIATTELAFAYNKGNDDAIKLAISEGYMGRTVRVWSTAADEGVCEICAALDGEEIGMDDEFDFRGASLYGGQKETPPAHPRCRCAVEYREVEPPPGFRQQAAQEPADDNTPRDVTEDYARGATPGRGAVTYEDGYKAGENADEIDAAEWLYNTYGGRITCLTRSEVQGVKTPDFDWNGRLWELKNPQAEKQADNAIKKALHQLAAGEAHGGHQGGIILNYEDRPIDIETLDRVVRDRMRRRHNVPTIDILVVQNRKTAIVWRFIGRK